MAKDSLLSIGKTAEILGVTLMTLRRWDEQGVLKAVHPNQSKHRYYRESDIQEILASRKNLVSQASQWATSENPHEPEDSYYCQTRDIFTARLERMKNEISRAEGEHGTISLIVAAAGEIGNNSFDHNIGNWPDVPGIFFGYDTKKSEVVLADRGQGVLATLRRVKPRLKNDEEALKTAFTEIISGRAPEARGNGLKFVKKSIWLSKSLLTFQSGNARARITGSDSRLSIRHTTRRVSGCLAIIKFKRS